MSINTLPPLPTALRTRQIQQQDTQPATTPPTSTCNNVFNLNVQRGATLSAQITISVTDQNGVKTPVNITGNTLQYTAKPHQSDGTEIDDTDPRTVMIDWQETNTPTLGQTWLIIPNTTTKNMQSLPYDQQLRMMSPGTPAIVTPLFIGSLVITEPVSARP